MNYKTRILPFSVLQALGAGIIASSAPSFVLAQDQTAQTRERIEVTGSNIRRVEGETALPVQIITREDIEKTGAMTTEQLLQTLTVANNNGSLVSAAASGATTGGISTISLRGLGSQRTLVLINGRRVAAYGTITDSVSVDVNNIPIAAIERIEVLKDGASAIYGSDAIAGVVNFILRKDYKGAEVTVRYAGPEHKGGEIERVEGAAGFGDLSRDRYNVLLVGSYEKDKPLFGRDRGFASSGINVGALNDTTSGNTFPANIVLPDGRTRNPLAPANCQPSVSDPLFPSSRCRFDPSPFVTLVPDTKRGTIYAAGHYAVTSNWDLYAEASYAKSEQRFVIQPVPISDQFALPPSHPLFNVAPYNGFDTIVLRSTSPYYPTAYIQGLTGGATPDVLVRYRSFGTGLRDLTDTVEQPRVVVGLQGTAFNWDLDASFLHSESKLREKVNGGYPSLNAILPLLNSGQVNFFGPNTPAVQALLDATQFHGDAYTVKNTLDSFTAKGSRDLLSMRAGSLALALGGEFRKEKFNVDPNATIQTGDISGYGGNFLPVDKSRNVTAFFGELNVPILKNLEANAAVRWDDYQNTGSKTTPKLGVKWQPTRELLLRAAVGKGFRAPSLNDLYQPNLTGVSAPGLNDPLRCPVTNNSNDCQTQFGVLTGGNSRLKPETSTNVNFGFIFEPNNIVSIGVDAFKINLKNTIIYGITANTILADLNQFGHLVTRGAVQPAFPNLPGPIVSIDQTNLNLGETRLQGADVDIKVRIPTTGWGKVTLALNGTYFDKYETQNTDGSFSSVVGTAQGTTGTGGLVPRWRHYATADWNMGPWDLVAAQTYQSGYHDLPGTFEDPSDPAFRARDVGAYEIYDLIGTYSGFRNLKLVLGVRNVFDRAPPYTNVGGQNYFQAGYDPSYADPRGRTYVAAVTYRFK